MTLSTLPFYMEAAMWRAPTLRSHARKEVAVAASKQTPGPAQSMASVPSKQGVVEADNGVLALAGDVVAAATDGIVVRASAAT